jgi:hypothetical protein
MSRGAWRQRVARVGLRQDWGQGGQGVAANGRRRRWATAREWGSASRAHRPS